MTNQYEAAALWGCADGNGVDPRLLFRDKATAEQVAAGLGLTVQPLYTHPAPIKPSADTGELQRVWRVVEAIPAINDLSAQYQNDIAEALLSERAELLATVERMQGALEEALDTMIVQKQRLDRRGISTAELAMAIEESRAALTTGEATTPNAGERG